MPPGNLHFAARYEHPVDGLVQSGWTGLADHHPPPSKLLVLDVAYFRLNSFLRNSRPLPAPCWNLENLALLSPIAYI